MYDACFESAWKKWTTIGVGSVFIGLYLFFTVYFYAYAFGSPDPKGCYFVSGLDTPELTRNAVVQAAKEANVDVKKGYPINIGHLFRVWFVWGFWGAISNILLIAAYIPMR